MLLSNGKTLFIVQFKKQDANDDMRIYIWELIQGEFCFLNSYECNSVLSDKELPEFLNQTAKQNVTDTPLDFTSVEIE